MKDLLKYRQSFPTPLKKILGPRYTGFLHVRPRQTLQRMELQRGILRQSRAINLHPRE